MPLLDSTRHLIDAEKLAMMKPTAHLVNTSRGPVIDEVALVEALRIIQLEEQLLMYMKMSQSLLRVCRSDNVIITPHIASATEGTRSKMSEMAAEEYHCCIGGG